MTIVKQGISDWLDNDGEMTSLSNLRLSASKSSGGADRGYIF